MSVFLRESMDCCQLGAGEWEGREGEKESLNIGGCLAGRTVNCSACSLTDFHSSFPFDVMTVLHSLRKTYRDLDDAGSVSWPRVFSVSFGMSAPS